jgi:hypothetical protein
VRARSWTPFRSPIVAKAPRSRSLRCRAPLLRPG